MKAAILSVGAMAIIFVALLMALPHLKEQRAERQAQRGAYAQCRKGHKPEYRGVQCWHLNPYKG